MTEELIALIEFNKDDKETKRLLLNFEDYMEKYILPNTSNVREAVLMAKDILDIRNEKSELYAGHYQINNEDRIAKAAMLDICLTNVSTSFIARYEDDIPSIMDFITNPLFDEAKSSESCMEYLSQMPYDEIVSLKDGLIELEARQKGKLFCEEFQPDEWICYDKENGFYFPNGESIGKTVNVAMDALSWVKTDQFHLQK